MKMVFIMLYIFKKWIKIEMPTFGKSAHNWQITKTLSTCPTT